MPQPVQTWYEQPCDRTGQLILLCQQPRRTTAAPASPVAISPMGHSHLNRLGFEVFDACFSSSSTATQPWGRFLPIRICRFGCAGNAYVSGTVPNRASRKALGGGALPIWTHVDRLRGTGVTFVYCGSLQAGTKPGNLPVTPGGTPVKAEVGGTPVIGRTAN
jgi:hypothetical protein